MSLKLPGDLIVNRDGLRSLKALLMECFCSDALNVTPCGESQLIFHLINRQCIYLQAWLKILS